MLKSILAALGLKASPTTSLTVKQEATNLTYGEQNYVHACGETINISPTSNGKIQSITITPDLPKGLFIDAETGVISGRAAAPAPRTTYTVVATTSKVNIITSLEMVILRERLKKETCIVCHTKFEETIESPAFTCPDGHSMDYECFQHFFDSHIADTTRFPFTCPATKENRSCNKEYLPIVYDKVLKDRRRELFSRKSMENALRAKPSEILLTCIECEFMVIYDEGKDPDLVYCQNPKCSKISCRNCNQLVEVKEQKSCLEHKGKNTFSSKIAETINSFNEQVVQTHLILCSLARQFQELLHRAQNIPCPRCGFKGRKDDACNHMTCNQCQTRFCYLCGLQQGKCDGSTENTWNDHNKEWETKTQRCPMYLQYINRVDEKWPSIAQDACDTLHRERSLRYLKILISTIPQETITSLIVTYPGVLGGFSLDDIKGFEERKFFQGRQLPSLVFSKR